MKDEGWTLAGWPAISVFLTLAVTPVATALVVSLPIAWLINHIFSTAAIHAVFGVERLGFWRVVGLFAIVFGAHFKIKFSGTTERHPLL
jgi:hypothetical protein